MYVSKTNKGKIEIYKLLFIFGLGLINSMEA